MPELGIHLLLKGNDEKNKKRIAYVDANWISKDPKSTAMTFKLSPKSAVQHRAIDAYLKKQKIDLKTFCERVVKVTVYALRQEDLLGRGPF